MFAVIYRFKLRPHQEASYIACWKEVVAYFKQHRGAIGSCLHKGDDGLWVAYSRWPNKATRDASWSEDAAFQDALPDSIRNAIQHMQAIKSENEDLEQYDEICLDLIEDAL